MNCRIYRKLEVYSKTDSGKNWKKKPDTVTETEISEEFYNNFINSIRFFNNFGYGAYCRAYKGYTYFGYVPVSVTTVNPGRTIKHIDKFRFEIA